MTPTDPHINSQLRLEPRPEDAESWSDVEFDLPSYDDMSTKPSWMRELPPLNRSSERIIQSTARGQLQELNAVDDAVTSIFDAIEAQGQLDDTIVMFTSDNGVMYGEQRIWRGYGPSDKNVPYDPAMRVALLMRGPGVRRGASTEPVCGQDLTATCVALARATPTLALDGVDLRAVITDQDSYTNRALLHERTATVNPVAGMPDGQGLTTTTRKLWRHETTSSNDRYELYLLDEDSDELVNVANDPDYRAERDELEDRLDQLLSS